MHPKLDLIPSLIQWEMFVFCSLSDDKAMIRAAKNWGDQTALVSKDDVTYTFKQYYDNAMKYLIYFSFTLGLQKQQGSRVLKSLLVSVLLVSILLSISLHSMGVGYLALFL